MSIEWTGSIPDLLLRLDRGRPEPLRAQLERELREAIRTGRLAAGERLPSSRALAQGLGVSRGLVVDCFAQLQAEGYLVTRLGSATRVAPCAPVPPSPRTPAAAEPPRLAADFRPGVPDLASFPRHDWLWALREASRRLPDSRLGYVDPYGDADLRAVLSAYLGRVRGAVAEPDRLVVCSGFAQGYGLLLHVLRERGVRRVAVEDPGDSDQRLLAARAGLETVAVPVDEDGLDVAALAATDARAVVLTPAHQCPTGVALAPSRRQALVAWARERDATIIEDDYDAEFRYDRDPVGSLQGLAPGHVAALGTVSKALAPALRLGWILCPSHLAAAVAAEKHLADRGSPGLDQFALALLMRSGRYDRHLRRMRASYARRRDALVTALARHAPGVELRGLAAGFHAVARLPERVAEEEVVAAARERSVGLYGMSGYRSGREPVGPHGRAELVLGFGNLREDAIARGIAAVADLLTAP
ncbi:PLP-dependent aminotransferase family protein [Nonomuraea roseoviolacea]|uniref:GntR family transcriptional regulator/MocR family aminotransferase n=1 Tax=Nonomuraea roseoviolacea subsp. carminata TaxID=160689 RepID=A0ABT1KC24_9ACTN|nr:PLP-dependent aminotransferase family protein [Nonomuraea roseoviolacea]MCP2351142.1 GntR family transcriptional regulator/MocR family aminotransferase [Nonomuraea roseoviolacea subsp. carminata]